jgi:hypothetical protein
MTRIRLVFALLAVTILGLFAAGCQKPFLVPTAFDLNANGGFYLERYFGQRYEDDDEQVHLSTGIRLWITDTIPILSPVDGIMEWCPPGVWCDQAQGFGTIRVTLKPKKDQVNELPDVKAVPQYVLVGGLQGSKVKEAVEALYLAEEADDPVSPTPTEDSDAETFATNFVKYGEAEPEAYVVRMGDVLGKPRAIGAASLGPRGRITITVLDPKGYYLDPMIYLNLGPAPQSAPVLALDGDTTPPQITEVTMYAHGSMSGANALGVQTVNIDGISLAAVVVPTASVPGDPALFDITVGVRDVGPPRCEANGGTETAPPVVTCEEPIEGGDPTRAIKQFDVEIFGLDPAVTTPPTVADYNIPMLTTPYQAGLYCLAEANSRLDGSGESDVGSDTLYNPHEAPTSKTSPHVYNLANLRARPEAECLPETWRDEEEDTEGAIDTQLFLEGEYKVVVTVTDFADQIDTHESWISVTSSPPGCSLEVSSCTAGVSFGDTSASACGSGDLVTTVNLALDIPPPSAICQGVATLVAAEGNVEVFLDATCSTPLALPYQWVLADGDVVPEHVYLRAGLDSGAQIEIQEVVLQIGYTNGATCTGSNNTVLQSGANAGTVEFEGGCCSDNGSAGCEVPDIAACVCTINAACCTGVWTEACVTTAGTSCNATCPAIDSECDNGICEINENPLSCPVDCQGTDDIGTQVTGFELCVDPDGAGPVVFAISTSGNVPFDVDYSSGGVLFTGQDMDGFCSYEFVPPSLEIKTETMFAETMDLSSVTLSWKEQAPADGSGGSQTFESAVVTWAGSEEVGPFGVIDARVTDVTLAVDNQGVLSGIVDFLVTTNADVSLGTNAILRDGISGTFSYAYAGGTGWTGTWNFGGIVGVQVDLVDDGVILATATANFQPTGVVEATLVQGTPVTIPMFGMNVDICDLQIAFSYNIANNTIDFLSGGGALSVSDFTGLTGSMDLILTFEPSQVTVSFGLGLACGCCAIGPTSLTVVGMVLSDLQITGVFTYDFELVSLVGTVSATHTEFNTAIEEIGFKIENGALSEFTMASFTTEFQGFELSVTNAYYVANVPEVGFSAKLVVPNLGDFSITNFKADGSGNVSIEKIAGNLTQSPLTGYFQASYTSDGTTSRFTGFITDLDIAGLVTVGAAIDVGTALNSSSDSFTFVYVKITAGNLPIPLVKKLAAEGGYNYEMDGIPGCPPGPGETCTPFGTGTGGTEEVNAPGWPQEGTYIAGFGLGIGDPIGIISLDLFARIQFGNGPTMLTAAAGIMIPQNDPWVTGVVTIDNYILGSSTMAGTLNANVSIPGSDPWFLYINGGVNYETSDSGWSVSTSYPIVATLFTIVHLEGHLGFSSTVSADPNALDNSFDGYVDGSLSCIEDYTFEWPAGFNGNSCSAADATDHWTGFGIEGNLDINVTGNINGDFATGGFLGSFYIGGHIYGNAKYKLPCFVVCGSGCVHYVSIGAQGSLTGTQSGQKMRVYGSLTFTDGYGNATEDPVYVDTTF